MYVSEKSVIADSCREITAAFKGVLSWKWDDRFEAALAEFDAEEKAGIRMILDTHLENVWNNANIEKAPKLVQTINLYLGGLMPEQLLFVSDPNQGACIFCAWWPWSNGKTISVRIRPFIKSGDYEHIEHYKEWFGL